MELGDEELVERESGIPTGAVPDVMELDYARLVECERAKELERKLIEYLISLDILESPDDDVDSVTKLLSQFSFSEINALISASSFTNENSYCFSEVRIMFGSLATVYSDDHCPNKTGLGGCPEHPDR